MKKAFIFTFLTILVASSCTKTVEFVGEDSAQRLVVLAEIEVGQNQPKISLQSTFSNADGPVYLSRRSIVDVYVNDELEPKSFRPDELTDDKSDWISGAELKIEEGSEYRLLIDGSEKGFSVIEASSRVPVSGVLEVQDLSSPNIINTQNETKSQFKLEFTITDNDEISKYYHISPYLILNDGSKLFLDIEEILYSKNAIIDLSHRHGILIDNSLVDETNDVSLYMSVPHDFENLGLSSMFMHFELKTVPKDYFLYHRSISQNVDAGASPFNLPTVTHTNFTSGYGLFATYAITLDSIAIN